MARREVIPVGFDEICLTIDEAEEAMVTTRNTCTTWKQKYAFWVNNSTRASDGSPASFAHTRICQSVLR